MKKILIYNGQLFMGGIERVLITYLTALSKEKDLDITLLIKENNPEKNIFLKDIPENIRFQFIKSEELIKKRERASKKRKNPFFRAYYQWLILIERTAMKKFVQEYFSKNKFDAIIDFDMSLRKYIAKVSQNKIGWIHYSPSAREKKKREKLRTKLKAYDKIVVICDEMREEVKKFYPESFSRTERIYNPMDIEMIRVMTQNSDELDAEEIRLLKEPYMVAVSRLVKGKGREDLIEIYSKLKKRGIKEKLYILGRGSEYENLKKRIEELDLEKDILLLGQKKNPYIWMKNAELFLHTSYGEGLPTVLIESMVANCPAIVYDCPTGPKEILGDGKYGKLIKTGDKKAFEEAVFELLNNPSEIEKYRMNFPEQISKFEEKNIIEQLKKLL